MSTQTIRSFEERLWDGVDKSGGPLTCWPCRARSSNGQPRYGTIRRDGVYVPRHRAAYEFVYGPAPAHLLMRHKCDNPPCCNPLHLIPGTPFENRRDMEERGRVVDQTRGTHCSRGHDVTGENRRDAGQPHAEFWPPSKACRICHEARKAAARLAYREARKLVRAAGRK